MAEEVLQALWRSDHVSARAVILVGNKVDLARSRLVSTEGNVSFISFTINAATHPPTLPPSPPLTIRVYQNPYRRIQTRFHMQPAPFATVPLPRLFVKRNPRTTLSHFLLFLVVSSRHTYIYTYITKLFVVVIVSRYTTVYRLLITYETSLVRLENTIFKSFK